MIDLNRKLPIGIQTFEKIRKGNYLYVDKTALVGKMVSTSIPYFLSRPRRFGKSLLISTFEAYFLGRKDLFEGLAISQMEVDWQVYPVFHIDLNARKYDSPADLIAQPTSGKMGSNLRNRKARSTTGRTIRLYYRTRMCANRKASSRISRRI